MQNQMVAEIQKMPVNKVGLYPRMDSTGHLISDDQMVSYREHLSSKNRIIFMTGPINYEDFDSSNLLMALCSVSSKPLKLIISSPGGYIDSAYVLCDTMKLCMKRTPIFSLGRFVCSAAVLPFVCSTKRYLLPHAKVMIHLPWGQIQGDPIELKNQQQEMEKTKNEMIRFLQDHGVDRTEEELLADINRPKWMDANEAIEYGLADQIITPDEMLEWLSE